MSMVNEKAILSRVESYGYAIQEGVLSGAEIDGLLDAVERRQQSEGSLRQGRVFAIRNLLDIAEIRILAESQPVRALANAVLGDAAFPVRGILFDKIPEANWKVPWHQDVTIAVQRRHEVEGFGPWSTKADILHVQPPAPVLERMISVRLHLDRCDESNGALRVIPGSHRSGRIAETYIPSFAAGTPPQLCAIERGGALLMRPLLLHASSASQAPDHRRVIHLDFACDQLPFPLKWLSQ